MITIPMLDHIVYATLDLAVTVRSFAELTGLEPALGGAHHRWGTANYLIRLGESSYPEIVGPDPRRTEVAPHNPFQIHMLTAPTTVTWAISPHDCESPRRTRPPSVRTPGPFKPMSRRKSDGTVLTWRLTAPRPALRLVPFLVDWGQSAHPTADTLPRATLLDLAGHTPAPERTRAALDALGTALRLEEGPLGLSFVLGTPRGVVHLPPA